MATPKNSSAGRIRNLRTVAADLARTAADDARGMLELWDARKVLEPMRGEGETDWWRGLTGDERRAIGRAGFTGGTMPADVVADHVAPGATIDDAMGTWLDTVRTILAAELVASWSARGRGANLSHAPSLGGRSVADYLGGPCDGIDAAAIWTATVPELERALADLDAVSDLDALAEREGDVDDGSLESLDAITAAPALMGLAEIAERVGAPRVTTVSDWHRRGLLPVPVATLKCGPVWYGADVERWLRSSATVGARYVARRP